MKHKSIAVVAVVATLFLALVAGGSFYMVDFALVNHDKHTDMDDCIRKVVDEYPGSRTWIDSLLKAGALRDTFVVMPSGERQHAIFVRDPRACGRTAVLVHGYHDSSVRMLPIASIYSRMGYNILLPDLHAHGLSDGDDIQMGWNDRLDVMHWTSVAERMFRSVGESSRVVLHGVSMGAATVMCVSGERQPGYVRCFVEDCGYTSVWDEFAHQLGEMFHLPAFPILYTSDWLCRLKYGWGFKEASPLRQVAKSRLPMLFIHGDKDDFVPFSMLKPLYEAKPVVKASEGGTGKEMWITRGTVHARSYRDYPEEYTRRVKNFVSKYME